MTPMHFKEEACALRKRADDNTSRGNAHALQGEWGRAHYYYGQALKLEREAIQKDLEALKLELQGRHNPSKD